MYTFEKWKTKVAGDEFTTWKIQFSSASNNAKFSAATDWLFKPEYVTIQNKKETKYPAYEIDYTNCKNSNIKAKMKKYFGKYKATVFRDPKQKNYFIVW
jgi:Pyruvate/2-oxoacid:ferredoxin oxidoreductase delta subunit